MLIEPFMYTAELGDESLKTIQKQQHRKIMHWYCISIKNKIDHHEGNHWICSLCVCIMSFLKQLEIHIWCCDHPRLQETNKTLKNWNATDSRMLHECVLALPLHKTIRFTSGSPVALLFLQHLTATQKLGPGRVRAEAPIHNLIVQGYFANKVPPLSKGNTETHRRSLQKIG